MPAWRRIGCEADPRQLSICLTLPMEEQGIGLLHRRQKDARDVDVGGAACDPDDDVGDVLGRERLYAFVDLGCAIFVAVEADQAEVSLHHAGVDAGDADGGAEDVLAEAVVDGALRRLGGAVDGTVGVGELAGG